MDNITKKFYRVDSNTWNSSLGLGLYIANKYVKAHNGIIEYTSKENQGTTFMIKIPIN